MPPNPDASGDAAADSELETPSAAASRWYAAAPVLGLRWARSLELRQLGVLSTVDDWLEARADIEGAEGLWRVDDNLYDLTSFVSHHPGGAEWLQLSKGTDVTELFYSHHISEAAERVLPKYFVRAATSSRNSPFTFRRDGFYMGLRSKVRDALRDLPEGLKQQSTARSRRINDVLAVSALLTCGLAGALNSLLVGVVGGLLLSLTASCAHNFFHQRHSWRRYYFDLSLMSSREWMVSHAMSHHMYPNSALDLEVTFFDPILNFFSDSGKSLTVRYFSWVYSIVIYASQIHGQFLKRLPKLSKSDGIALVVPATMLLFGSNLVEAWLMWTWILAVGSLHFAYQGLTAGHHHPRNFHHGDACREDTDFGLMQLDTTAYCSGVRGRESLFLCLTHFGDHRLHHLFPSIDHALLPFLEPIYSRHLQEHGISDASISSWEALKGKYLQLAKNQPNLVPPEHRHN